MEIDLDEASSSSYSRGMSFNPWMDSHPPPDLRAPLQEWSSWLTDAMSHEVSLEGLCNFIQTSGSLIPGIGQEKWTQMCLKLLEKLSHCPSAQARV